MLSIVLPLFSNWMKCLQSCYIIVDPMFSGKKHCTFQENEWLQTHVICRHYCSVYAQRMYIYEQFLSVWTACASRNAYVFKAVHYTKICNGAWKYSKYVRLTTSIVHGVKLSFLNSVATHCYCFFHHASIGRQTQVGRLTVSRYRGHFCQ